MTEKAVLQLGDKKIDLPVFTGTEGEKAVDITSLRSATGHVTYDPAYGNTGSCRSAITFIDGEKGILRYRGIPIEQFDRPTPNFIEIAWLLIFGRLPKQDELDRFRGLLTEHEILHENMKNHFEGFPAEAPPMAILSAAINAMSCYNPHFGSFKDAGEFEIAAAKIISKIRTMAAFAYRRSRGLPFIYPAPKNRYCGNFLHMMFALPYRPYEADPEVEDALNLFLILHADHEQNCSTSTVRMVGSSQAGLFPACAAGVLALWGPLHGGANSAVIHMLEQIRQGGLSPEEYIRKAKDKTSGVKLMGFGHRVYKNFDPRAKILKKAATRLLTKLKIQDPLLDIALGLEEKTLADPYFAERKLYPNVDFYSGIILRAIGIPVNMFTVLFAIGRLPGWIAHWKEQHDDPSTRIMRPRQIYTGPVQTDYTPVDQR